MDSRYTPIETAVAELRLRREKHPPLCRDALEARLASRTYAVLFRAIASPNFEMLRFVSLALAHSLTPLVLEHHSDKLVFSSNPGKHALARMRFHNGIGRNGGARISALNVTDMSVFNGRTIADVTTVSGESLVGFHHHLLSTAREMRAVECFDASSWLNDHGVAAQHYYPNFMSLLVDHAILFETFITTPAEAQFASEVVIPAFDEAFSRHGRHPLICRLDPIEAEGDSYWYQYPHEMHSVVVSRLSSRTKTLAE